MDADSIRRVETSWSVAGGATEGIVAGLLSGMPYVSEWRFWHSGPDCRQIPLCWSQTSLALVFHYQVYHPLEEDHCPQTYGKSVLRGFR